MKDIRDLMEDTQQMQNERTKLLSALLDSDLIQKYLKENNIGKEYVEKHIGRFLDLQKTLEKCAVCKGDLCKGYRYELVLEDNRLKSVYKACPYLQKKQEKQEAEKAARPYLARYEMAPLGKQFQDAGLEDVLMAAEKDDAYRTSIPPIVRFLKEPKDKGLYLYGKIGVGKTYLCAVITNELAKKNRRIVFLHMPSYASDLKNAFDSPELYEYLIEKPRKADVLVLDDIGAESISAWYRDEVLLPLIDRRMQEKKLTLFTSNLSIRELEEKMAITRNEIDEISAQRVCDRIRVLAEEIQIKGKNRRLED